MTRIFRSAVAVLSALLVTTLVACEAKKSSNPLSPSVAGPIPGVEITAPKLLEPGQGFKFKEGQQPIRLLIENSSTNGVRPLSYTFEVATDTTFGTRVFARSSVPPGDGGRTSVQIDKLDLGRTYYWRARAEDGANSSQYASSRFEVLPRAQLGAPVALYPVNNERVDTRRPVFRVRNADRNSAIGSVRYEFQLATNQTFTAMVASLDVGEGAGETQFALPSDLSNDVPHFWRVRASDGDTTSDWMTTQTFRTPLGSPGPGPGPSPTPVPGGGGSCASNNGPSIAQCIAAKYPEKRAPVSSLAQRQANMEFLRDRMIEAGKCGGLDLGHNLKRGGPETSIDFLAWRRADGDMGVDIGMDYDNIGATLQLYWGEAGLGATYKAYPMPNCSQQ